MPLRLRLSLLALCCLAAAPAAALSTDTGGKAGMLGAPDPNGEPSAVFKRSAYLCMGYNACRDAGMGKVMEAPSMQDNPPPWNGPTAIFGGFTPIFDTDH